MALSTVWSVPMSISSQQSLCACGRRDDAEEVRLPVVRGRSRSVVDISGHSVHLRLARRIGGVIIVVAVFVLGKDFERRVKTEEVAVIIGAEHE
eukprot:6135210-Pleurochrysis_carterae.AAC.1